MFGIKIQKKLNQYFKKLYTFWQISRRGRKNTAIFIIIINLFNVDGNKIYSYTFD